MSRLPLSTIAHIRFNPPLKDDQAAIVYQGCTYIISVEALAVKTEVNMLTEIEIRGFIQNGK